MTTTNKNKSIGKGNNDDDGENNENGDDNDNDIVNRVINVDGNNESSQNWKRKHVD